MIRPAVDSDLEVICGIYNHFVEHTIVTFATAPVDAEEMRATVITGPPFSGLVSADDASGRVTGFAAVSAWKSRCAYRHSLETTIYLAPGAEGKGLGAELYARLLEQVAAAGYHTVLGGIALPNPACVALHEKLGFTQVALLKEVGRKFDRWLDVGYWQKIL